MLPRRNPPVSLKILGIFRGPNAPRNRRTFPTSKKPPVFFEFRAESRPYARKNRPENEAHPGPRPMPSNCNQQECKERQHLLWQSCPTSGEQCNSTKLYFGAQCHQNSSRQKIPKSVSSVWSSPRILAGNLRTRDCQIWIREK